MAKKVRVDEAVMASFMLQFPMIEKAPLSPYLKLAKVVTNKILSDIDEWKSRPLQEIYPILFIDAVHFSVRQENVVKKLTVYVVLGISEDGMKNLIMRSLKSMQKIKMSVSERRIKISFGLATKKCSDGCTKWHDNQSCCDQSKRY